MLLARGVDIDAFNTTGQTAVHAAAGRGADAVVKFLAGKGAALNLPDKQGRTPLDVALGVGGGGGRNAQRGRRHSAGKHGHAAAAADGGEEREPVRVLRRGLILALLAGACFAVAVIEGQQPPVKRSVRDGVFSERQAGRGRRVYGRSCEHCHGASLEGSEPREIPALVFEPFMRQWSGRTVAELSEHVSRSMPADDRGSLTPRAYGDVVAFVLESNGFPAGSSDLPEKPEELAAITIERPQP